MAKLPFPSPTSPQEYASDFLTFIGAPLTPANVEFVTGWANAESPSFPGYNAFGTTLPLSGSTNYPGNTAGVQEYPTLTEGLTAAKDMIFGGGPQSTALAPALGADLKSGGATKEQLAHDLQVGNPQAQVSWAGTYVGGAPQPGDAAAQGNSSSSSAPASSATLTSFNWNPLSWINSLGNISQQAGQDANKWLNEQFGSAVKGAAGFTSGAIAAGATEAVGAITGTSGPGELGLRAAEIVGGAILFAIGLFALVYALTGHAGSDLVGSASKGAALAAAVPK